ncbi:MAG: 50S ribosomal protein L18a [Thermoprotei archaeon]|nr:MAG: 50S ribosomal protein L18a [Thermoprotei archaeon]
MLIGYDRFPRILIFVKDIRAVKLEDAVVIACSELRSRMRILRVYEIPPEETKDSNVYRLSLNRIVPYIVNNISLTSKGAI